MPLTTFAERESFAGPLLEAPDQLLPEYVDMVPGESRPIDPSNPLSQIDEFHQRPLLARIHAGNDRFVVLAQRWDETAGRAAGPYFLVHEDLDVQPGDPVESVNFTNSRALVGHAWQGMPFNVGATVDNEHFQVRHGKNGLHITNYHLLANTVLEQAESRPEIGLKERVKEWAFGIRERLGRLAMLEFDMSDVLDRMDIRADRPERPLRRLLGGVARFLIEPEFIEQEPFEVVEERNNRIAAAALVGPMDAPANPTPRVHRQKKWVSGNKSHFYDGVTDSVRGRDDEDDRGDARAPYGYFRDTNFPIIGRDSPTVRNGIYVSKGREALLMDYRAQQMQEAAAEMKDIVWRMLASGQPVSDRSILWEVRNYTRFRLPYSSDGAYDKFVQPLVAKSGILPMSELLDKRFAICNGQAPFAVFLVEELIDAGLMFGTVSVERKMDKRTGIGHATLAFDPLGNTDPGGVLVADLSGRDGFVGTRQEARDARYWYDFDLPAAA